MRVDSRFSVLIINGDFELPSNLGIWWHWIVTLLGTNISPYPFAHTVGKMSFRLPIRWDMWSFPGGYLFFRTPNQPFMLDCLLHRQVSHSFSKRSAEGMATVDSPVECETRLDGGFIPFVWKRMTWKRYETFVCFSLFCQHSSWISDLADILKLCVAIFTICLDETTLDWVHMSWVHSDYKSWKKTQFLEKELFLVWSCGVGFAEWRIHKHRTNHDQSGRLEQENYPDRNM